MDLLFKTLAQVLNLIQSKIVLAVKKEVESCLASASVPLSLIVSG